MSYYQPPGGAQYPYGYHPQAATAYHPGTPGAYTPYQYPPQGYGGAWPYPYGYYPQQQPAQPAASTSRVTAPAAATTAVPASTATTTAATTAAVTSAAPANTAPAAPVIASTPVTTVPLQRTYSTAPYTYTYHREPLGSFRSTNRKKRLFDKELRQLMYGFGDDRTPASDTVDVMEEILIEYIIDISRLSIEDLRRALSRPADAKKLARMEELLFMQEDIKRARAQFEESEMNQASSFQT
ncbi:hypothetical protein EIP86_004241 [Pleurotus ostreatoroseus]|nr:hypothetical protein EIP86_004241 [Pleurotus ostreatoroseus]